MTRLLSACLLLLLAAGLVAGQNGTCPDGFSGNGCSICQTDQGCVTSTGDKEATCSNDVNFYPNSQVKSYSCEVTDGLLSSLVVPGSLLVQCNTGITGNQTLPPTDNTTTAGGNGTAKSALLRTGGGTGRRLRQLEGSSCRISFRVADPGVDVVCDASECTMSAGAPFAICNTGSCGCPGGCNNALIDSLMGSVEGPLSMDCKPGGACSLTLSGLPIDFIPAQCDVGECLVPTDQELNVTEVRNAATLNYDPIIAAIPSITLTIIVAFLGSYAIANRQLWKYTISDADASELERLAKEAANPEPRLSSLEFKNLTVIAPVTSQKELHARQAALLAKSLHRPQRSAAQHAKHEGGAGSFLQTAKHTLLGGSPQDVEAAPPAQDDLDAEAMKVAEYVVGLHTAGTSQDQWYILKDLSFTARAGDVVGVVGPSGCGKTSLLGSIAGSASDLGAGVVQTGVVLVDGKRRRKRTVAYVPQSDVFIPTLTVQECVRYSALLRLPVDTQPLDLQVRIERILEELGLQHIANSQVGGSGQIRGVSGGERRRLTIGMELVTDPAILVLDEPTSGLDSFTALNLMRTLRHVAARGRVVIASLHQPSRDMFLSLDAAILMAHGRMLYAGRPGDAEAWFARRGLPCPEGTAMAEHMLKVASSAEDIKLLLEQPQQAQAQPSREAAQDAAITAATIAGATPPATPAQAPPSGKWASVDLDDDEGSKSFSFTPDPTPKLAEGEAQQAQQQSSRPLATHSPSASFADSDYVSDAGAPAPAAAQVARRKIRKPGVPRQLAVLFWRAWVDIVRNPTLLRLHMLIALLTGLLTGFVFWDLPDDNTGVQNGMGGTFFALAFFAFASLTTVDLLMNERAVVTREVRGGYYSPVLYLASKLTLDGVLLRMLPAVLYWAPFYYMAGFRTGAAYAATYVFILITFSGAVGALSMAVTVAADTPGQASFTMNFILLFSLIFTGFLVNVNSIPAVIRWVHYLSVFYYAFEAMVTNEISGRSFRFQAAGFGEVNGVKGDTFLVTLGFRSDTTTRNIVVLVCLYAAFALLTVALFYLRLPRTSHGGWRQRWAQLKQRCCGEAKEA